MVRNRNIAPISINELYGTSLAWGMFFPMIAIATSIIDNTRNPIPTPTPRMLILLGDSTLDRPISKFTAAYRAFRRPIWDFNAAAVRTFKI